MADLDAELAALRDAVANNVPMVDLDLVELRDRVTAGNRLCADGPSVAVTDLGPTEGGPPVPVRVYEGDAVSATLLYAHGGGWVAGDLSYSDEFCRYLAEDGGVRVASVDYRLAPEHPFPAGLEDLSAAWAWASRTYDGALGLGGDSSGGNLAAALAHRLARTTESAPAFLLLVYPPLGLPNSTPSYRAQADAFPVGAADMHWFFAHYLSGVDVRGPVPDLVPLHATDLSGMPRTHVVLAAHDPLHDEGAAYTAALSAAGVRVTVADHPDLCHGFLRLAAASAAVREARAALVESVRRLAAADPPEVRASKAIHAYDSAAAPAESLHSAPGENRGIR